MDRVIIERVKKAITALKKGELIILTDDKQREHEGDLVGLAAFVTPQKINQALTIGRGVLCVPMNQERANQLNLPQMVTNNSEKYKTQFTISVDHQDSTTGVSAFERAHTIKELGNYSVSGTAFETPGHIFPLVANDGGVLKRRGHTEGAVDLARLAGVPPVAYIIEILAEDGHMAQETQLADLAKKHGLIQLSIADIIAYRKYLATLKIKEGPTVKLPSEYGNLTLTELSVDGQQYLVIKSNKNLEEPSLVRLHSECITGEIFGSKRCECGPQLHAALKMIDENGGVVIYLKQEGRGIGLHEKLRAYVLQENVFDTYDANVYLGHQPDERDYTQAATILKYMGMDKIKLLTNNPSKIASLKNYGIEIVERKSLITGVNNFNQEYLDTKKNKFKHLI